MPYFVAMGTRGERLKKARIDAGYRTAADAARALTVSYSTYASHENGTRDYGADEASTYSRKYKVSVEWLLTGRVANVLSPVSSPLATINVIGTIRAGFWQDVDAGDSGVYAVVPAAPDAPSEWQYAFTVEGTSLNKIALPGDILICLDAIKAHYDLKDGDLVVVERSRYAGQMVERTAKRARRAAGGVYELWPESTDPAFQSPMVLKDDHNGDEVRIVAKVLWIMRKP
jgi:SOS-response transcriptional repressor LexA